MARFEFKLPDIGEGIAEAEVVEWFVSVGDVVAEDQPVAAMMTDKATIELESPVAGTIIERVGEVGDMLAIGSLLVAIDAEGEGEGQGETAPVAVEAVKATPAPAPTPEPAPEPAIEEAPEPVDVMPSEPAALSAAPKAKVLAASTLR